MADNNYSVIQPYGADGYFLTPLNGEIQKRKIHIGTIIDSQEELDLYLGECKRTITYGAFNHHSVLHQQAQGYIFGATCIDVQTGYAAPDSYTKVTHVGIGETDVFEKRDSYNSLRCCRSVLSKIRSDNGYKYAVCASIVTGAEPDAWHQLIGFCKIYVCFKPVPINKRYQKTSAGKVTQVMWDVPSQNVTVHTQPAKDCIPGFVCSMSPNGLLSFTRQWSPAETSDESTRKHLNEYQHLMYDAIKIFEECSTCTMSKPWGITTSSRYEWRTMAVNDSTLRYETQRQFSSLDGLFLKLRVHTWEHLTYLALQNIGHSNNNGLMFIADLAACGHRFEDEAEHLRALANGLKAKNNSKKVNAAVNAAANRYLTEHYGDRLMLRDIESYSKTIQGLGHNFGLSKGSSQLTSNLDDWVIRQREDILFDNLVEEKELLREFVRTLDALPTLENGWDMIPYSFVIDWFISVGDCLNAIDNWAHVIQHYKYVGNLSSIMATRPLHGEYLDRFALASVSERVYARRYRTVPIMPIPEGNVSPSSAFTHWLEAGMLIVQRIL